ncbi:methyl-accepting chemotaxis protein [Ideonella sp.]|uniref:methyl-accepting chemotaxis protein n=1 Tax=Ideonella sp. TaxID=1929293 RepID=UPI003BB6BCFA
MPLSQRLPLSTHATHAPATPQPNRGQRPGRRGLLNRALSAFIRPGALLIRQLRMPVKLALIATSVLLPLVALMAMALSEQRAAQAYADTELEGLALARLTVPVIIAVQRHRGLHHRVLAGDASAEGARRDARAELALALAALDQAVRATQSFDTANPWDQLKQELQALSQGTVPADAAEAFAAQTGTVEALRQWMLLVGERSGLVLDPEARSYFLMDMLINSTIPTLEAAALARGQGAGLLARGEAAISERSQVVGQAMLLQRQVHDLSGKLQALQRAGGHSPASWSPAEDALQRFAQLANTTFSADSWSTNPKSFFDQGSEAIQLAVSFSQSLGLALHAEIRHRQERIDQQSQRILIAFGLGAAGLGYLLSAFYLTFQGSLRQVMRSVSALASGDLSGRVEVRGRDELRQIGDTLDGMTGRLSAMVADIRSTASRVDMAGTQVSDGSGRLAGRTEAQANSLRGSVNSIEQLSAAVAVNAESARQLDTLTQALRERAESGNHAMAEAVDSMTQVQASSQRVAEMITVIDDVAFQTSMLSLNASVEAARAGDAGTGFGVVASEVRQLAQRCAESAEEIRRLINHSESQVARSAAMIGGVSASLSALVEGVHEVSDRIRSISEASTQQSAGLSEVSRAVGDLDAITRENAELVEESAAASHDLVTRAQALRAAVASMRLRQGSADEALALVQQAQSHVAAVGRERASVDFHDRSGRFVDRDLYIFAFDRNGVFWVNGSNPDLVGQTTSAVPGLEHSTLVPDAWKQVDEHGSGWVQYEVLQPSTGKVLPKESFVMRLSERELIGCGCYRSTSA